MKTYVKSIAFLFLMAAFFMIYLHCAQNPVAPEVQTAPVNMHVAIAKMSETENLSCTLTISASDMETDTFDLVLEINAFTGDTLFTGEFEVSAGSRRLFTVRVYSDNILLLQGSKISDVKAGVTLELDIQLISALDRVGSDEKIRLANESLANIFYYIIESELENISRPDDIDFSPAYEFYKMALDLDATNPSAHFGLALTELMMISVDPDINQVYDRWEAFLDTASVFEAPDSPARLNKQCIDVQSLYKNASSSTSTAPIYIINTIQTITSNPPMLSEIQDVMQKRISTRIDNVIEHLNKVIENDDFIFLVTPKMMGDTNEDEVELDLTEVYGLLAMSYIIRAFTDIMTAYNSDFTSYDRQGMIQTLSQGSDFQTLRTNAEERLAQAKSDLISAMEIIEAGIDFLENESDNQDNDIIKLMPGHTTHADLDSIVKYIQDTRQVLNGNYNYTANWDDSYDTPNEALTFNFSQFFDNPIQDLKSLFPAYTVTAQKDTAWQYDDHYQYIPVTTTVHIDSGQAGYYEYNYYYRIYKEDNDEYFEENITLEVPAFTQKIDSLKNIYLPPDSVSYINISCYMYEYLEEGDNLIEEDISFSYETKNASHIYYYPVFTYTATSFSNWIFPDPTCNGILPGMTDSELKRIFGLNAENWQRINKYKWWDF